jgi:hypothetical protein
MRYFNLILIISIIILIIYLFNDNQPENFGIKKGFKKIVKKAKKTSKKIVRKTGVKKLSKKVIKSVKKNLKTVGSKLNNFAKELEEGATVFKDILDDMKEGLDTAVAFTPIGPVADAIEAGIKGEKIDWNSLFNPCAIIGRAFAKVAELIEPLIQVVAGNLAKNLIELTKVNTVNQSDLKASFTSCLLRTFLDSLPSSVIKSMKASCQAGNKSSCIGGTCQDEIPKVLCDGLPDSAKENLIISTDLIFKFGKPLKFEICKPQSPSAPTSLSSLISWIQCALAPVPCAIAKTLGAVCSIANSVGSGKSAKDSFSSGAKSVEGFSDISNNTIGAYYINKFDGEVIIQASLKPEYNLSYKKNNYNGELYKNTSIYGMKFNNYTTNWEITYNSNGTIYIKSKYENKYLGYGNVPLNTSEYNNLNSYNFADINSKKNVLFMNSSILLDGSDEWVIERIAEDDFLYAYPTVIVYSYTIKHSLTGEYLGMNLYSENKDYLDVYCSPEVFEWTFIPKTYYQPDKYKTPTII